MAINIAIVDDDVEWVSNKYVVQQRWLLGYVVIFEDTVLSWYFWKKDADIVCAALNGAYNVGRSDKKLELIFDSKDFDTAVRELIDATHMGCIGGWELREKDNVIVSEKRFFNLQRKAKALEQMLGKE